MIMVEVPYIIAHCTIFSIPLSTTFLSWKGKNKNISHRLIHNIMACKVNLMIFIKMISSFHLQHFYIFFLALVQIPINSSPKLSKKFPAKVGEHGI